MVHFFLMLNNSPLSRLTTVCCCCCSVTKSCPTLCNSTDCGMLGFPVPHHLLEFAQVHVHCISDAIQPSHPLLPSSPSAFHLSTVYSLTRCIIDASKFWQIQTKLLLTYMCRFLCQHKCQVPLGKYHENKLLDPLLKLCLLL